MNENIIKEGKTKAVIGYITIFGSIISIFMNLDPKNAFARFHIRQGFGIWILFYVVGLPLGYFDSWFVSGPFYLAVLALWLFGFSSMLQGETRSVPLVGAYFQRWFTFIQ